MHVSHFYEFLLQSFSHDVYPPSAEGTFNKQKTAVGSGSLLKPYKDIPYTEQFSNSSALVPKSG